MERADPDKGRFRNYLLASLKKFLIDQFRDEHGKSGTRPKTFVVEDPAELLAAEPSTEDDPDQAYHRQSATSLLNDALATVEKVCRDKGMTAQWTVFEERVLRPAQYGCEKAPIQALMVRFGLGERSEIDSMLQTIKRMIKREMLAILMLMVDDPSDAESELEELRSYLCIDGML